MIDIKRIIERVQIKTDKIDSVNKVFMPQRSKWKNKLQSIDNFKKSSLEYYLLLEIEYLGNELKARDLDVDLKKDFKKFKKKLKKKVEELEEHEEEDVIITPICEIEEEDDHYAEMIYEGDMIKIYFKVIKSKDKLYNTICSKPQEAGQLNAEEFIGILNGDDTIFNKHSNVLYQRNGKDIYEVVDSD